MKKLYQSILILCLCVSSLFAQNINRIEYFINADPGFGLGTAVTGFSTAANVVNLPTNINIATLPDGLNTLYLRSRDVNMKWSITNSLSFIKQSLAIANVTKAEYFFNTDPGFGLGTNLAVATLQNISQQSFTVDVSSLTMGLNTLYVRTKDSAGKWSITNNVTFIKVEAISNLSAMEYFIDTDPGFGLATAVPVSSSLNVNNMTFSADVTTVTTGSHNLFVRSKNAAGKWSLTNVLAFKKTALGVNQITETEKMFLVYPNPAKEQFTVQSPADKTIKNIDLIDVLGRTVPVKTHQINNQIQVETSGVAKGIFFVRIATDEDVIFKKLLIE